MDNKSYQLLDIKQVGEEIGQNNNNRCSAPPKILPGVHELIAQSQSYPLGVSYDSCGSNIPQRSHLTYNQILHPSLQYSNSVGVSDIRYPNSARVTSNIQYQNDFRGSNVCSNPNPIVYEGESLVYPSSGDVRLSLVHPVQQKHEVGSSWFSSRFVQDHHVQSLSSSQWWSDTSSVSKLPSSGYGSGCVSGGLHGLQFVSACQTHILGPIQQPQVQPTPPCFWTDSLKSQTLRPLPRPISSTLETGPEPQVHHHATNCYGSSQFKHCVCSALSTNPPTLYHKTCLSGQHVCQDSQLYNVSFVNNAFMASISPQYHRASVDSSQTSTSLNLPVTATAISTRECEGVSLANNVLNVVGMQSCGKQGTQLDENCNHIYSASVNELTVESMDCEYQRTEEKNKEEDEASLEEENAGTSAIEKYIESVPDFQSLSQIHTDQRATEASKIDQTGSTSIFEQDPVTVSKNVQDISGVETANKQDPLLDGNCNTTVSPQTVSVSSERVHNTESKTRSEIKNPALKTSFTKTKRKCKRGFSQLDNLANRLKRNSITDIRNRSNECRVDGRAVVACSSSSSEISPVAADQESPSTSVSVSRRRSYRSRNFSKEFFNRWSSFEDVPLVISRQPDHGIVCSTPKQHNTGSDDVDRGFSCDTCGKRFFSHYSYTRHMKKHKISYENCQRKVVKSRYIYRCSLCNVTWADHDQFVFHSRYHMSKGLQSLPEDSQECQPKQDDCRQDSVCEDKGQLFTKTGCQNRRYICSICGDSLSSSYEYNLHCSQHGRTDDVVSSNESDSSFSSPRYFYCGVCDVKFVNRFMYSKHCVSEKHRTNQKVKETEMPESDICDTREWGNPTQLDQTGDRKLSSSGRSELAGNGELHKSVLGDPNPVIHSDRRNKVQLGLLNKSAEEISEVTAYNTIKPGVPTSVNDNVNSGDNNNLVKQPHEQHSLKKSSKSAVNCRFLYLRAKYKVDKSCPSSRHTGTKHSGGFEQNNMVCNQTKDCVDVSGSAVSNTCQVSSGNTATHEGLKGSRDENNNPTDFPRCSEHYLSNRHVPTSNSVSGLSCTLKDNLNSAKASIREYSQLKSAENGNQVNGSEVPTDDSGLETSCELIDGKCSEGLTTENSKIDTDKTQFVDTASSGLFLKSGMISNKTSSGQEDAVPLKGDSGLWSDEEMGTCESDVEESMDVANQRPGGLEVSSRTKTRKDDDQMGLLEENALKSMDWCLEIMDTSARSGMIDSCLEPTQSRLIAEKDVIALEVKYDANANCLDLGESVELVDTSNLKHLSESDLQSTDLKGKQELLHDQNTTADVSNKHISTEDKSNKESNKNHDLDQPRAFHRSRRAKQSRLALLLDSDFHNGKIYFCEICGETFVNPFRYSAHYKKRAHMELASQHGYGNISDVGTNVSRKIREKGQNSKTLQDDNNFKRVKTSKAKKDGKQIGRKRRKNRKSQIQRSSAAKINVKKISTSLLDTHGKLHPLSKLHKDSASQISQMHCRKMERRWSDRIPKSNRLKKMASSNKLKKLKSKLLHSSRHYNLRLVKTSEKSVASGMKNSQSKKANFTCTFCSLVFPNQSKLHLHMCSERMSDVSVNRRESGVGSDNENNNVTTDDKKTKYEDRELEEQSLKKRKPVVKCPALSKMLTATKELQTDQSPSSDTYTHAQKSNRNGLCASKRHMLITKNKNKNSVNSNSVIADSCKPISKLRKCHSKTTVKNPYQTESPARIRKPYQTGSLPFAKKPKLASSLLSPWVDTPGEEKPVKSGNTKPLEFCEVCEKFYSSRSHLYRHYRTITHKKHLQAKRRKQKNDVV